MDVERDLSGRTLANLSDGMYDTNGFTGLVDSGITGKRASLTLSSNIKIIYL
jgi:hypothetical protein